MHEGRAACKVPPPAMADKSKFAQLIASKKLDGRRITRVRGNKEHVASHGYACEKAQRIDYYQNGKDRLD